mmetsp:Transcript_56000/g.119238  ORF Transcript_56000/g.119238 Transcript_56000/m.119238 type:complete len:117 (+) Transcript_56000:185-535(+)
MLLFKAESQSPCASSRTEDRQSRLPCLRPRPTINLCNLIFFNHIPSLSLSLLFSLSLQLTTAFSLRQSLLLVVYIFVMVSLPIVFLCLVRVLLDTSDFWMLAGYTTKLLTCRLFHV